MPNKPNNMEQEKKLLKEAEKYFKKSFPIGHSGEIEILNAYLAGASSVEVGEVDKAAIEQEEVCSQICIKHGMCDGKCVENGYINEIAQLTESLKQKDIRIEILLKSKERRENEVEKLQEERKNLYSLEQIEQALGKIDCSAQQYLDFKDFLTNLKQQKP